MTDPLDPDPREARILKERKGSAAYPRRGLLNELTNEDRHWNDLREHYVELPDELIERRYYKERCLEILNEAGHMLKRVRIPMDGLSEENLYHCIRSCGYPEQTLRARIRRQGGAYYGCKTFRPRKQTAPYRGLRDAPAPLPNPTPAPPPAPAHPPASPATSSGNGGWEGLLGTLGLTAAGIGGYALLANLNAAEARGARNFDRDILLSRRDELLAALARRPDIYRGQEAAQRLERLTPDDQESDDLSWILKLWMKLRHEPTPHNA